LQYAEWWHPERCVHALIPSTYEFYLFGERVFENIFKGLEVITLNYPVNPKSPMIVVLTRLR
jgi:hypothetical protein